VTQGFRQIVDYNSFCPSSGNSLALPVIVHWIREVGAPDPSWLAPLILAQYGNCQRTRRSPAGVGFWISRDSRPTLQCPLIMMADIDEGALGRMTAKSSIWGMLECPMTTRS